MATDPTTIPQLADLQQAKKDMTDINTFTLSQSDTFTDNTGVVRKTITGIENDAIDKAGEITKLYGFRPVGDFATGFTYQYPNDTGKDANGETWIYLGALPFVVSAGTTPVEGLTYKKVGYTDHNAASNRNAVGAHDDIYTRNFKSTVDLRAQTDANGNVLDFTDFAQDTKFFWQGYYAQSDGGSNWGLLKFGDSTSLTDDGGSIFIIVNDAVNGVWVEANLKTNIVNVAKFGVMFDGSDEFTKINNAIQNARQISLKPANYGGACVVSSRLVIPAGVKIKAYNGAVIKKIDGYTDSMALIRFNDDADNCTIENLVLDGNRDNIGTTSENGHLFDVRGGTNITAINVKAINGTGDGFYIGGGVTNKAASNIKLINCEGDNNRRQALSITSVKHFRAVNFVGMNTNGTDPQAGIDIEPNDNDAELFDIILDNPRTQNNAGVGIVIAMNLIGGVNSKTVSVIINNHRDVGSAVGFVVEKIDLTGKSPVQGVIKSIDPIFSDNGTSAVLQRNYDTSAPEVQIIKPSIINPNRLAGTSSKYHSSIISYRESTDSGASKIGNLRVVNPTFNYSDSAPVQNFYFRDLVGVNPIQKIKVENPTGLNGSPANGNAFTCVGKALITDEECVLNSEFSSSLTLSKTSYSTCYTNNETSSIIFTLPSDLEEGYPNLVFKKKGTSTQSAWMRVSVQPGGEMIGNPLITPTKTSGWEANSDGSTLTLKPIDGGKFLIVSATGDFRER